MKDLHILIIPSWYPNINNSLSGIFFKEQTEALANNNSLKIGCIAINEVGLRQLFKKDIKFFYYSVENINKVFTISLLFSFSFRLKKTRRYIRLQIFKYLFKKYVSLRGLPDIIHLHSFHHGDFAIWIKKKYGIEYVVTEHSSGFNREIYNKDELQLATKVFKESKQNIAVSKIFKNRLEKQFGCKFKYIPNFIDTDFFSLKKSTNNLNKICLINIAFLNINKQHKMLVEAFNLAFKNNNDVELLIVGDGAEYNNLDILIKKLNLQNRVRLYGRADKTKIKQLLHSSDIFVLSSLIETFGVVVIEAMSCGLPVLSTKSGGPESIIIDESYGILSENNLLDFSKNMEKIVTLYKENKYNSNYIREYVVNNFSQKVIINKILKIYKGDEC